tara:strand:+ start:575 stop:736 length:162 start_codon:yes stop_codon:yes gene_type:complete
VASGTWFGTWFGTSTHFKFSLHHWKPPPPPSLIIGNPKREAGETVKADALQSR